MEEYLMGNFILLNTPRLTLRDHRMEDLESYHRLFSDAQTMYYLDDLQTKTMEESTASLMQAIEEISKTDRTKYFLRIQSRETAVHIGEIGYYIKELTPLGTCVEMGYFIYPSFWGKGYVTEAAQALMEYAFEENGVWRITAGCISGNRGSERVMQKCGMRKEGEYQQCVWHDGAMRKRVSYGLLKSEWQNKSQY